MIYFLIFLDVIINNYTPFTSFFFLIYLYQKPYKYYLLTALILDFLIFNTYFYNLLILSLMYLINQIFNNLNKNNFYVYLFFVIFNYLSYIILSNILNFNSIYNILISIGTNLIINMIFYILAYKKKYLVS